MQRAQEAAELSCYKELLQGRMKREMLLLTTLRQD